MKTLEKSLKIHQARGRRLNFHELKDFDKFMARRQARGRQADRGGGIIEPDGR